jgi:hypothetical protein
MPQRATRIAAQPPMRIIRTASPIGFIRRVARFHVPRLARPVRTGHARNFDCKARAEQSKGLRELPNCGPDLAEPLS